MVFTQSHPDMIESLYAINVVVIYANTIHLINIWILRKITDV